MLTSLKANITAIIAGAVALAFVALLTTTWYYKSGNTTKAIKITELDGQVTTLTDRVRQRDESIILLGDAIAKQNHAIKALGDHRDALQSLADELSKTHTVIDTKTKTKIDVIRKETAGITSADAAIAYLRSKAPQLAGDAE